MKFLYKTSLHYYLIAMCCLLFSISSKASHIAGMDLTYKFISGTTYQLNAVYYYDCSGVAGPASSVDVSIKSVSGNISRIVTLFPIGTGQVISSPCNGLTTTCNGGAAPGIEKWEFSTNVDLGSKRADWEFSTEWCCRNIAITTIQNNNIGQGQVGTKVTAKLNNLIAPTNSSPKFTNDPVAFICLNQNFTFNHGGIDADGDSLVYSFVMPQSSSVNAPVGLVPVTYSPPYSFTNPLSSSTPITLNSTTGNINMTPSLQQITILAVEIKEYRNGVLIGIVVRDMQIWVTDCGSNSLPVASGINGTSSYSTVACAGKQICFDILTQDANANQNVTLSWNNGIPNGVFTQTGTTRPIGHFCWTPTATNQGSNIFTVTVKDNACPSNGLQVFSYNINVGGGAVTKQVTNVSCNGKADGKITLTVNGGLTPYTYLWNTTPVQTTATAINLAPGTYSVAVTDASGCKMTASATITQPAPLATSITTSTGKTSFCTGESLGLNAGVGFSSYLWSNNSTQQTIIVTTTGTYSVIATNSAGCAVTASITVKDSACCPYAIGNDSVNCNNTTFCVMLRALKPVTTGIIGMNYCLSYDSNVMTPTGNYTLGNVVKNNLPAAIINTGAQAQLNTNIAGSVHTAIYYTSAAPTGTFWTGTGDVICIEFTLNPGVLPGTFPFSACSIDEDYTLTSKSVCATAGSIVSLDKVMKAKIVYWNYDQTHASPARPMVYDAANPSTYNKTKIASTTTSAVDAPNMKGEFIWDSNKGTAVTIKKQIIGKYGNAVTAATCEDVFSHINGADAYLAALISTFDVNNVKEGINNWKPNVFQMLSSDVNMDDKVLASDVTLIMSRSVRSICEFPQVWNYTQGTVANPTPNTAPGEWKSFDWRFFDSGKLYDNTNTQFKEFQADPAYPVIDNANATKGYWRDNVPDVPEVLPIIDTTDGACPKDMTYYGVMLGDVDGYWNASDPSKNSRDLDAEMIYDVANMSTVSANKYRVAVYAQSEATNVSFDFNINYNENKIKNVLVSKALNADITSKWNDLESANLYLTSFTLKGITGNTGVLYYIDFETTDGTFGVEDLGAITSLVNGKKVPSTVNYAGNSTSIGNTAVASFGSVLLYPNPSKGEVNYEIHVSGIKRVNVAITNLLGQVVYQTNQEVNETLRQNVTLTNKGVYFVRVTVDNKINVSRVVVE